MREVFWAGEGLRCGVDSEEIGTLGVKGLTRRRGGAKENLGESGRGLGETGVSQGERVASKGRRWQQTCFHWRGQSQKEHYMKDSTKDKVEGKVHEAKGAVKEKVGHATNDPNLVAEGQDEKLGGKIQKKVGDVEKVFEK
jgi:uncharacterized protein YjbJ (UPF0337 family)